MGEISFVVRGNVFVVVIHGRCKGAEVLQSRPLIIGDRCCVIIYRFRGMNGKLRQSIMDFLPLARTWRLCSGFLRMLYPSTFVVNNNKKRNPYKSDKILQHAYSKSLINEYLTNIFNYVKYVMDFPRIRYFEENIWYNPISLPQLRKFLVKRYSLTRNVYFLVAYFSTSHTKLSLMKKWAISVLFADDVKSRFYLILGTARAFAVTSAVRLHRSSSARLTFISKLH